MCRGPLAYGHATAVSTRELMRPNPSGRARAPLSGVIACGHARGGGGERLVATLQELIAIPSIGGTRGRGRDPAPPGRAAGDLGLAVDLWPIDLADLRGRADYPGEEVDRTRGLGPGRAPTRPDERPALILQGHVDVVPPG